MRTAFFKELKQTVTTWGGCETCDYGSSYVNYITFRFNVGQINIETCQMYEYVVDEGSLMGFLLNNIEQIKKQTFDETCEMLRVYFTELCDEGSLDFKVNKIGG